MKNKFELHKIYLIFNTLFCLSNAVAQSRTVLIDSLDHTWGKVKVDIPGTDFQDLNDKGKLLIYANDTTTDVLVFFFDSTFQITKMGFYRIEEEKIQLTIYTPDLDTGVISHKYSQANPTRRVGTWFYINNRHIYQRRRYR